MITFHACWTSEIRRPTLSDSDGHDFVIRPRTSAIFDAPQNADGPWRQGMAFIIAPITSVLLMTIVLEQWAIRDYVEPKWVGSGRSGPQDTPIDRRWVTVQSDISIPLQMTKKGEGEYWITTMVDEERKRGVISWDLQVQFGLKYLYRTANIIIQLL